MEAKEFTKQYLNEHINPFMTKLDESEQERFESLLTNMIKARDNQLVVMASVEYCNVCQSLLAKHGEECFYPEVKRCQRLDDYYKALNKKSKQWIR